MPAPGGEWHTSFVVPDGVAPEGQFVVGAACWARDSAGQSANFYEYPGLPFDVTDAGD